MEGSSLKAHISSGDVDAFVFNLDSKVLCRQPRRSCPVVFDRISWQICTNNDNRALNCPHNSAVLWCISLRYGATSTIPPKVPHVLPNLESDRRAEFQVYNQFNHKHNTTTQCCMPDATRCLQDASQRFLPPLDLHCI